jgi:hypothetical protein
VCELCNADAYVLPPAVLLQIQECEAQRRTASQAASREEGHDYFPRARKFLFMCPLALTLGLILAAVLGWMDTRLRKSHVNIAIGVPSFFVLFGAFHRFIFDHLLPNSVTRSWHAVLVLLMAFSIVDGSLLLQLL